MPSAVKMWSLNHWAARELPGFTFFNSRKKKHQKKNASDHIGVIRNSNFCVHK